MKTISNDLDLQEKWIGIRQLKKGYAPMPFHRNNSKGNHVKYHERAEATAEYLATKQWGQSETDKVTRGDSRGRTKRKKEKGEQLK